MSVTMLADAVRSEAYRFARDRTAVIWSVLFVPVFGLVAGGLGQLFLKQKMGAIANAQLPPGLLQTGTLDMGQALVSTAGGLANPGLLLFILIGLSTLFAADYRWETWRLTSARNTRPNLILGKVGVAKLLILAAMIAFLISEVLGELVKAAIFDRSLAFNMSGDDLGRFFGLAAIAWIRVIQFAMLSLLAAVLTRSLLAALFIPIVVSIGQFFLMQAMPVLGWEPGDWIAQLALPGLAYDTLKALIQQGAAGAPEGVGYKAAISLILWLLLPLAAAIAWFGRQDLSKE